MPPGCGGGWRAGLLSSGAGSGAVRLRPQLPWGRRGSFLGGRDRGRDVCGFSPDKPAAFCGVTGAIRKKSAVLPETAVGLRGAGPRPGAVGPGE